jgi:glyoxylase-like metal-dependent hydrolase (beta-lactamase superfamily II)
MQLEDHWGDILRKGRMMAGVSLAAAARAGGINSAELSAWEATGQVTGAPDYQALARAIGLDGAKLEGIARGWRPQAQDLKQWRQLRQFTSAGEGLTVNCFLGWDEETREAGLFDTGFDAAAVLKAIGAEGLRLRHVFITHSHHDHVHALAVIREAHPQAEVHSNAARAPLRHRLQAGTVFRLGALAVEYRETPGHAADGVTYLIADWPAGAPRVAVVGDAIFAGSMGRGNDSWDLARGKVREHILSLPPATLICPGHGPLTTVGEEQDYNPFF